MSERITERLVRELATELRRETLMRHIEVHPDAWGSDFEKCPNVYCRQVTKLLRKARGGEHADDHGLAVTHHVKSWPEFFGALWDGRKTFEVRRDDRGYQEGQILHVHEWEPRENIALREYFPNVHESCGYTGRSMLLRIKYISRFMPGMPNDVVGMSVEKIKASESWGAITGVGSAVKG